MTNAPSLKHPGRWIWLLLLIPVILGFARLRVEVEILDLLPRDLPEVQGLRIYQENFADARELILTISGSNAEAVENAARSIATGLRQDTNNVATVTWAPPWLERPGDIAELIGYLWFNQPPETFSELAQRLQPVALPGILAAAREQLTTSLSPQDIARLSYDPFGLTQLPQDATTAAPSLGQGQQLFSSADGCFRLMFVKSRGDLATYRDCIRWLEQIRARVTGTLTAAPETSGIKIGYTGRPAFVAEIAGGMERDMNYCVGGTAMIIAVLFWLAHRRLKPMLWLLALLAIVLVCTMGLGGLIYGTINVISMGFAAILLGLAVDYAVVHYQEALAHPKLSIPQVRHAIAPSIFWAAVTTIAAFLVLNLGGLPGLGQMGTLVGVGVSLAALIMVYEFLPPLFPRRRATIETETEDKEQPAHSPQDAKGERVLLRMAATCFLLVLCGLALSFGLPRLDGTADPLRPRNSQAYATLAQVQKQLGQKRDPLWVIARGSSEQEVARDLEKVQAKLRTAQSNGLIAGFTLPVALWPRPEYQSRNRSMALQLAASAEAFRQAATAAGFTGNALALTDDILHVWERAGRSETVFEPTNRLSRWILDKFSARSTAGCYALGLVQPPEEQRTARPPGIVALQQDLANNNTVLSGWELLGGAVFARVKDNLWKVLLPMVALVLASLFLAFRRWREILLSLAVLSMSGLILLAVMRLAGWSWNLLNLTSLPLMLGTGVDYSLFVQLALRRYDGDVGKMRRSVGRALLLCGGTAIAGFGSLGWSSNAGMASLGVICAVGIASNMFIAIFLLPAWWQLAERWSSRNVSSAGTARELPSDPSVLYSSGSWRLAMGLVRIIPVAWSTRLTLCGVHVYWLLARRRRAVVIANLLPVLNGDIAAARKHSKALFRQFAFKLVDLWRYEAGLAIDDLFGESAGWEHFTKAHATTRGVLLVTPHLGNWEFGGLWLSKRGVDLQVITLAEPGTDFTQLRKAARARWSIETLVIRNDPFAFLEIIRRLEAGATVALLIDRPPEPTATTVQLFGQPFPASIAAAELARASGCAILPVYVPRVGSAYEARILPAIPYERATLRDRAARQRLTQEILKAFEPAIRQYPDQWFQFVPVWGKKKT